MGAAVGPILLSGGVCVHCLGGVGGMMGGVGGFWGAVTKYISM